MRFWQIRRVKRSVFAKNAELNGAFSAIMRYSRKSGYVLGFNTYLNKILEILGLGLVYYWMMPKNCEKRNVKSRACVPLRYMQSSMLKYMYSNMWRYVYSSMVRYMYRSMLRYMYSSMLRCLNCGIKMKSLTKYLSHVQYCKSKSIRQQ